MTRLAPRTACSCTALLVGIVSALALGGSAHPAANLRLSLSTAKHYATGANPNSFVLADLNADRRPDVVTANFDGKSVSVLLSRRNGRFAAKRDYGVGTNAESVKVAELNGDGKPDLVVKGYDTRFFAVFLNQGDGKFAPRLVTTTGRTFWSLRTADLNGDGRADVVTRSDAVSVFLNNGDGTFLPRRDYELAYEEPGALVVADLNHDARPDFATPVSRGIAVFLNNGDGSFGPRRKYSERACCWPLVGVDVNRDGAPDLVSTYNPDEAVGSLSVLLNRGNGSFRRARTYAVGGDVGESAVADLNGDSAPELVAQHGSRVSVFLNRGNGTFLRKHDYPAPWYFHFTVGDVNGGAPDLVFASWDLGRVGVLLNRGHGMFGALLEYRTLGGPTSVAVADLNDDRARDVLTLSNATDGGGDRVSVLLNAPGKCDVQDVFRSTLEAARARLVRGDCRLGRVTWGYSTVKPGRVMGQRPKFGTVLQRGTAVDVVLSRGQRG